MSDLEQVIAWVAKRSYEWGRESHWIGADKQNTLRIERTAVRKLEKLGYSTNVATLKRSKEAEQDPETGFYSYGTTGKRF